MSEKVELTEEQQRQFVATGRLFHTLASDPKYRKKVLGLIKDAAPETVIPELEMDAELDRRHTEARKQDDERFGALTKEVGDLRAQIGRDAYRVKAGLTEDELVDVEALAKEGKIGDPDTAVNYYRALNQLGTPRGTPKTNPDEDYLTKIRKIGPRNVAALKKAATERATSILNETRRRVG